MPEDRRQHRREPLQEEHVRDRRVVQRGDERARRDRHQRGDREAGAADRAERGERRARARSTATKTPIPSIANSARPASCVAEVDGQLALEEAGRRPRDRGQRHVDPPAPGVALPSRAEPSVRPVARYVGRENVRKRLEPLAGPARPHDLRGRRRADRDRRRDDHRPPAVRPRARARVRERRARAAVRGAGGGPRRRRAARAPRRLRGRRLRGRAARRLQGRHALRQGPAQEGRLVGEPLPAQARGAGARAARRRGRDGRARARAVPRADRARRPRRRPRGCREGRRAAARGSTRSGSSGSSPSPTRGSASSSGCPTSCTRQSSARSGDGQPRFCRLSRRPRERRSG